MDGRTDRQTDRQTKPNTETDRQTHTLRGCERMKGKKRTQSRLPLCVDGRRVPSLARPLREREKKREREREREKKKQIRSLKSAGGNR